MLSPADIRKSLIKIVDGREKIYDRAARTMVVVSRPRGRDLLKRQMAHLIREQEERAVRVAAAPVFAPVDVSALVPIIQRGRSFYVLREKTNRQVLVNGTAGRTAVQEKLESLAHRGVIDRRQVYELTSRVLADTAARQSAAAEAAARARAVAEAEASRLRLEAEAEASRLRLKAQQEDETAAAIISAAVAGILEKHTRRKKSEEAGAVRTQYYQISQEGLATLAALPARVEDGGIIGFVDVIAAIAAQHRARGEKVNGSKVRYYLKSSRLLEWRTIKGSTPQELSASLWKLQDASYYANNDTRSDPVPASAELDHEFFTIEYQVPPRAGALGTGVPRGTEMKLKGVSVRRVEDPYFHLVDFTRAGDKTDDCVFKLLRGVRTISGMEKIKPQAGAIRKLLGFPAGGPINITDQTLGALGDFFGIRIRAITGITALDDHERQFDDDAKRPTNRNRCTSMPEVVVVAQGGPLAEGAPQCDMHVANGHCTLIRGFRDPLPVCPITGDVYVVQHERGRNATPMPPEPAEIKKRVKAQGRKWLGDKMQETKADSVAYGEERIIVYDYETVSNPETGELVPYSLGWCHFDAAQASADFTKVPVSIKTTDGSPERAMEVTAPLLEWLLAAPANVRYTLVSFNGCRFDHFLLARAACNSNVLTKVFATQGLIRGMVIGRRHQVLDIAKIVAGCSLADACAGFATTPTKLDGFSHRLVQRMHEQGELEQWLQTNRAQFNEYQSRDVQATASLFVKVSTTLGMIAPNISIIGPNALTTVGSIAYRMMKETCSLPEAAETQAQDQFIRGAVTGGRVQIFEQGGRPQTVQGPLAMVDVTSLYSTAMAAPGSCARLFSDEHKWGCYPSQLSRGEAVNGYVPGAVGVYNVLVLSQPTPSILPRRAEGESLGWHAPCERGAFETRATQCDIELIRAAGGSVVVGSGFVWRVSSRGLFEDFINKLMTIKNEQDALKKAKDPRYNAALRELVKLLMNSASGKCCQRNFEDTCELAAGSAAQYRAWSKLREGADVENIILGAETVLILGKKPVSSVYYRKQAKPAILAVLIYSYARSYVWKTALQYNPLYCDTDSAMLHVKDYHRFRADFPQFDPEGRRKMLGDWEQEIPGAEELLPAALSMTACLVSPKDYAVFLKDHKGAVVWTRADEQGKEQTFTKLRVKGVHLGRDQHSTGDRMVRTMEEASKLGQTVDPAEALGDAIEKIDHIRLGAEYHEDGGIPRDALLSTPLHGCMEEFMHRRIAGEKTLVFCSQLTRTYKSTDSPFSLSQRYMMKDLTCKPKAEAGPIPDGDPAAAFEAHQVADAVMLSMRLPSDPEKVEERRNRRERKAVNVLAAITLGPDPNMEGYVRCSICEWSVKACWAAKHLESAFHKMNAGLPEDEPEAEPPTDVFDDLYGELEEVEEAGEMDQAAQDLKGYRAAKAKGSEELAKWCAANAEACDRLEAAIEPDENGMVMKLRRK